MALDRRQTLFLESVRRFLRRSAFGHLLNMMAKARPHDFAPIHQQLSDRERTHLFRVLTERDPDLGASFLVELPPEEQLTLVRLLGPPASARLIERCADDDSAGILASLEEQESQAILEAMIPEEKAAVEQLLVYEEETAGRIMTPDVFSLPEMTTVGEAVAALQSLEDIEMAFYVYVVDERRHLVGVLSLRELLLHTPQTTLRDIMNTDLITCRTDQDQEDVARLAAKYDLLAIPVVDDQGRLVGVVTIDDVIDVLREEATEDIFRVAGTSAEERIEPSIWKSVKTRSPWLLASFLGGVLALVIIGGFESTLSRFVYLAAFIPIVLNMGGSAGNQTAIVVIRGLATRRIEEGRLFVAFSRELGIASVLGTLYGVLLAAGTLALLTLFQSMGLQNALYVSFVIGASLALSMFAATLVGSTLPLLLHRTGIDPAIATTPFVTTTTDIFGSLIFLGLATALISS
jgi:magnesium transporter